jgi:HEAT repeat protein
VPKPKRRWRSYLVTTKQDWAIKDVPRVRYEKPQEPIAWVPVLCKVLDARHDDINNEDIVDTLDLPADPRALPSLVRVLNDYPKWPDWDGYGGLAIKAIWAIRRIGTPEAMQALRAASTSPQIQGAPYNDDVLRALQDALSQ